MEVPVPVKNLHALWKPPPGNPSTLKSYRYIAFPVHRVNHWSLAIGVNLLVPYEELDERDPPCILYFDSLGENRAVYGNLRQFGQRLRDDAGVGPLKTKLKVYPANVTLLLAPYRIY